MASYRIQTRPARQADKADMRVERDPDILRSYKEDAAHFPGGRPAGIVFPRGERDVAEVVTAYDRVLPIGAQSSLTGGATPVGDLIISTSRMNRILEVSEDRVRMEPGVTLAALQQALDPTGRYYPPAPTFDGATIGGTVATNAAGAATFKYGSTRNWIQSLVVVLANGDTLDIERGQVVLHAEGYFEVEGRAGVTRVPVPTYRMPDVAKRSAGYHAAPGMDLIDLFIGSEGTLGVITQVTVRVIDRAKTPCWLLVPFRTEASGLELVQTLRDAAFATWRERDPRGIDVTAIEQFDRRCLELLCEDGMDRKCGVSIPAATTFALLVQVEVPPTVTAEQAYSEIGDASEGRVPDTALGRVCGMLQRAGVFEHVEIALPGDRARAAQLFAFREAAPAAVNRRVALAKEHVHPDIEKTAADMIVPFPRFVEMVATYRRGLEMRGLDYAIWGHVSDGNVHPNVIPRSIEDVRAGQQAILEFGREVTQLGGCPLAEHGVGRSPIKQQLLRNLYGDAGIDAMRRVKRALDPDWKLAPGVVFPARGAC